MSNPDIDAVLRVIDAANRDAALMEISEFSKLCEKHGCESPIEILFAFAFQKLGDTFAAPNKFRFEFGDAKLWENSDDSDGSPLITLCAQVPVRTYRVDFAIRFSRGKSHSQIAVECDGYDFHHGNPIAAAKDKARDREIAASFDAVLRFTGAELFHDAYRCASEALILLLDKKSGFNS